MKTKWNILFQVKLNVLFDPKQLFFSLKNKKKLISSWPETIFFQCFAAEPVNWKINYLYYST